MVGVGCAGLRQPVVRPLGGISGTVVDAATGAPLAGAVVQVLGDHRKHPAPPEFSSKKGEFTLLPLVDGRYDFTVEHPGYFTASASKIAVEKGYYTTVAVRLIRDPDARVFEAAPKSRIDPPVLISGPVITYPKQAPALQGKMLVRCVLTRDGVVKDCLADQDVPELAPMIRQLEQRRYRPALRDGLPLEVWYVFRLNIVSPD